MGVAFALWLSLAAVELPMDWCLGRGDGPVLMESEVCVFFEEQTHMARLDTAYAALREASGPGSWDEARAAFLLDRDIGCAVWADFLATVPSRFSPSVCRMRRLFQRIGEIEEHLRGLRRSMPPGAHGPLP